MFIYLDEDSDVEGFAMCGKQVSRVDVSKFNILNI